MCYCSNQGDTEIRVSVESWPWRRKFSHHSCWDSNPRPFDHQSGTLTPVIYPCSPCSTIPGLCLNCCVFVCSSGCLCCMFMHIGVDVWQTEAACVCAAVHTFVCMFMRIILAVWHTKQQLQWALFTLLLWNHVTVQSKTHHMLSAFHISPLYLDTDWRRLGLEMQNRKQETVC